MRFEDKMLLKIIENHNTKFKEKFELHIDIPDHYYHYKKYLNPEEAIPPYFMI
jgi:hypothetical protein